jgi:SAM-dependent methyltransferase
MVTTHELDVHPANRSQFDAWDGEEGGFWAAHAEHFDRSVARYQGALFDAAGIRPTDRVLDIGCGTGATSRDAARRAADGSVLALDLSAAMLEVARRTPAAEGGSIRYAQADAQIHPFEPASVDVVISRTGGTFFADPVAAWTNIAGALRPGGRLAMLAWQPPAANEWIGLIVAALAAGRTFPLPPPGTPGPFAFGDPDAARTLLASAGFVDVELTPLAEPMWFGRDADDACAFVLGVSGWMLRGLDDDARERALAALRRTVEEHATDSGVEFGSAMWLVTGRRAA